MIYKPTVKTSIATPQLRATISNLIYPLALIPYVRIALTVEWFSEDAGGVASHVKELSERLLQRGHEVAVITNATDRPHSTRARVVYLEGPQDPFFKLNLSIGISKGLQEVLRKFDIVHAHHAFARIPLASISASHSLGIPSVLTTHTVTFLKDYDYFWTFFSYSYPRYRLMLSRVKKIIAVSEAARRFISCFTSRDVVVIPNGVDTRRFAPRDRYAARDELGLYGEPLVLYVGRLVPKKGVDVLLLAAKEVVRRYPRATFVIAGSGALEPVLKALVRAAGLERNVVFMGYVDQEILPRLYNAADIFVLPSVMGESFGIVLLEAMSSGVPVVATDVGGIPEVLDGKGMLVPPGKSRDLCDAILRLWEDEARRERMARDALKMVRERYSWDSVLGRIMKVYESVSIPA